MEFTATAALSLLPFVHPSNQNLSVTLYARNVSRLVRFRLLIRLQIRLRSREYKYGHDFSNVALLKITFLVHLLFWSCNPHLSFLAFVLFVLINSRKPSKLWEYKQNDTFLKPYSKSKRKKVANH